MEGAASESKVLGQIGIQDDHIPFDVNVQNLEKVRNYHVVGVKGDHTGLERVSVESSDKVQSETVFNKLVNVNRRDIFRKFCCLQSRSTT